MVLQDSARTGFTGLSQDCFYSKASEVHKRTTTTTITNNNLFLGELFVEMKHLIVVNIPKIKGITVFLL